MEKPVYMYNKALVFFCLVFLLISCAGNPAGSVGGERLKVKSKPVGAEVYVMGELLGLTPLELSVSKVFPVVYPPEKQKLYGHVVLMREGCETKRVSLSTQRLARGIHVQLVCQPSGVADTVDVKLDGKQSLQALQRLLKDGFINELEYQMIRQRILKVR